MYFGSIKKEDNGKTVEVKPILNTGLKEYPSDLFASAYQNDDVEGKRHFLVLWLHAYKYSIPMNLWIGQKEAQNNENNQESQNKVKILKTKKPEWADQSFKMGLICEEQSQVKPENNGVSNEEKEAVKEANKDAEKDNKRQKL